MKKDAYYFSHDANAQDDPKCLMLIEKHGMEGYGIFWALIERLRCEKDSRLPVAIIPALARKINSSKEKIESVVNDFGLFVLKGDYFFSQRLKRSMLEYKERSAKGRQSAMQRWGNAKAMRSHCKPNAIKERKVKKSKEKKIKTKLKYLDFLTMTDSEYQSLISKYGKEATDEMMARLNDYIGSHGEKYKSHYHTIKNWFRREKNGLSGEVSGNHYQSPAISKKAQETLKVIENVMQMRGEEK